jgi:hypothetical protein
LSLKIKLSKKTVSLMSRFILTPLFPTLGCVIGYALYGYGLENNDTWKDLGSPPGEIEQLLAVDTATIYAKTNDGRIFSCYRESQYDQDCWNEVDRIPADHGLGTCPNPIRGMPPEPDGVVERLVGHHCIDSPVYTGDHVFAYLLLGDGKVMQWISEPIGIVPPPNQFWQFTLKTLGGCFIGIIASLVVPQFLMQAFSAKSSAK